MLLTKYNETFLWSLESQLTGLVTIFYARLNKKMSYCSTQCLGRLPRHFAGKILSKISQWMPIATMKMNSIYFQYYLSCNNLHKWCQRLIQESNHFMSIKSKLYILNRSYIYLTIKCFKRTQIHLFRLYLF